MESWLRSSRILFQDPATPLVYPRKASGIDVGENLTTIRINGISSAERGYKSLASGRPNKKEGLLIPTVVQEFVQVGPIFTHPVSPAEAMFSAHDPSFQRSCLGTTYESSPSADAIATMQATAYRARAGPTAAHRPRVHSRFPVSAEPLLPKFHSTRVGIHGVSFHCLRVDT